MFHHTRRQLAPRMLKNWLPDTASDRILPLEFSANAA